MQKVREKREIGYLGFNMKQLERHFSERTFKFQGEPSNFNFFVLIYVLCIARSKFLKLKEHNLPKILQNKADFVKQREHAGYEKNDDLLLTLALQIVGKKLFW